MALVQAPLRALDIISPLDRTGGLLRAALIEVSLQELAHQFLAPSVQLPFEVAYSGRSGSPNPVEVDHRIRSKWITESGRSGSLPEEVDHPFRTS